MRCEVVEGHEATGGPIDHVGGRLPDNWRQNPGLRFEVVVDLTPLESGHFGHRGWLTWRVRVDDWLDVRLVKGSLK